MSQSMEEVTVELPEDLVSAVDECYVDRGFESRSEFIQQAVRDGVMADDPFTPEAREKITKARELAEEEESLSLDEACEELGIEREKL